MEKLNLESLGVHLFRFRDRLALMAHDMHAGVALANEQIDSGRALARLRAMQDFT